MSVTHQQLTTLLPGQPVPFGGDKVTWVPRELAEAFRPGDRLVVVQHDGALLHVPAAEQALVERAVGAAVEAFAALASCGDDRITAFYEAFAARLADDATFAPIGAANAADVAQARERGRSTTRLELTAKMRADMVAGLRGWTSQPSGRDELVRTVAHDGWRVEVRRAPLGVVGFVFEGRPNVFADACGVLRTGNTVVFRIGSDALGTARAIVTHALAPALEAAGLPAGAAQLVDAPSRAAGWALFADSRLSLAVARGSGTAVAQLGAVARQAGVPVSLHGTGGAWLVAGRHADAADLAEVVVHSLDRKVCNTLNVCCVPRDRADELVPVVLQALERAAAGRGTAAKLHVLAGITEGYAAAWLARRAPITRAEGVVEEPQAELLDEDRLGTEWEWESSPEITLAVVDDLAHAVALCNRWSPRLVASLCSRDPSEHEVFWRSVDTPFVGNGFTRWVDGQFALGTPELGLSNWEAGRLFARGGVLSGDSVYTLRARAVQDHPGIHR